MVSIVAYVITLACCAQPPEAAAKDPACTCAAVKQADGWCAKCKVGYLAGVKVDSESFFEALDAHGHDIDPTLLRCDWCKKAYESHGFCNQCKIGFVRKQAFFSKLTYYLARGEVKKANSITCPTCLKNTQKPGWCESCRVGMVGFHAYTDKQDYERATRVREILVSAIERAKECMSCAIAMINDGPCVLCKASFENGSKVPRTSP